MLNIITAQQRASVSNCLDVDVTKGDVPGLWNCLVQVVDPDPAMARLPYQLFNATMERLAEELEKWSLLHGSPGAPLPVFFRKAEPQVLVWFLGVIA